MAGIELPYGYGSIAVEVPTGQLAGVVEGRSMPSTTLEQAFESAWEQPIGMENPLHLLASGESLVFVVTDHTRSTPTQRLFPLIWERIRSVVSHQDVTLLVGTGTHRPPTGDELDQMLGPIRHEFRLAIHDCDTDLVEVGRSRRGTRILLNRLVVEADHVVTIGHIGMHYYAGYSGGRKNILPGVAGRETIEKNHALLMHPGSEACVYDANPISQEMVEAAKRVHHDFIVDVVQGSAGDVVDIVVGEAEAAHAVGRALWDKVFRVPLAERADLVIASAGGHPSDIDLYQAYKAQYNAVRAVRDGGIVLLVAACPDGIGHSVFTDWITRSRRPEDVLSIYEKEGFRLGGHKAVYLANDLRRAEIRLVSDLAPETVRRFFLIPETDPNAVVAAAQERFGEALRVLVMPHAADTFPVFEG